MQTVIYKQSEEDPYNLYYEDPVGTFEQRLEDLYKTYLGAKWTLK